MATFRDLREFLDKPHITLPIGGTDYIVYDVDAETGLWAQTVWEVGVDAFQGEEVDGAQLDDGDERTVYERVLGETLDQMLKDGVGWADVKRVGLTALIWIAVDEDTAARFWEAGATLPGEADSPAATQPNRASRRASAAAARTTRTRASGSTTKGSTSTSRKAAASPGAKSLKPGPS